MPEIVHGVGAAERHHHESAGRQQRRHGECQQIARLSDGRDQVPKSVLVLLETKMFVHRLHHQQDGGHRDDRQADQGGEADMPVPVVGQKKPDRDTQHLACRERGLHEAHDAAAQVQRKQVGDDREHDRAHHAAEQSGDDPAEQQHMIVRRERAESRAKREADIEEQQQALAIEPIGKACRQDTRNACAEGIGRDRHAELGGGNIQRRHDDGAERRHDHEVDNDRELDQRQQRHDQRLVTAKSRDLAPSARRSAQQEFLQS